MRMPSSCLASGYCFTFLQGQAQGYCEQLTPGAASRKGCKDLGEQTAALTLS